jgi:hypothetical protein
VRTWWCTVDAGKGGSESENLAVTGIQVKAGGWGGFDLITCAAALVDPAQGEGDGACKDREKEMEHVKTGRRRWSM